jgi:hypothetical protein
MRGHCPKGRARRQRMTSAIERRADKVAQRIEVRY